MIKQLASFLLLSALQAERPMEKEQQVVVAVQLDAAGRVLEAKAESGNPSLYKRAIEAAKKAKYAPDCDDRGRPVGPSTKVFAFFDERGSLPIATVLVVGLLVVTWDTLGQVSPNESTIPTNAARAVEQMRGLTMRRRAAPRSDGRIDGAEERKSEITRQLHQLGSEAIPALARALSDA